MATVRDKVLATLDHIAHSVDNIEGPVLDEVLSVLGQAHREVERELKMWLNRQGSSNTFTAARYHNVLANLRAAFSKLEGTGAVMEDALKTSFRDKVGPLSIFNVRREWERLGGIFEGTVQAIPIHETVLMAQGKRLLWPRFETSAEKYAGDIGERTRFHLSVSRARAETIDELTNRLERHLPDVFRQNRWDAERLARSETMNAYNEVHRGAIEEAHAEDPSIRERWDATFDFRRCPMCASLDGQVVDVSKGEKYLAKWITYSKRGLKHHQREVERAPAHPCCRCSLTIWRESWAQYSRRSEPRGQLREAA